MALGGSGLRPQTVSLKFVEPTPESIVFSRIRQQYGHFARPLPARETEKGQISVPIQAEIPVKIEDAVDQKSRVAWISLGEVAQAALTRSPLRLLDMPSSSAFGRATRQKYKKITQSVEADLVSSAPLQFGQLTYSKVFLQSLGLVIFELESNLDIGLDEAQLRELEKKTEQHEFLVKAGYAEIRESVEGLRLVPNPNFVALRGRYQDPETFAKQLLGIVFAKEYDLITNRLRMLKSYVRGALAYYSASYEFGELLSLDVGRLERRYAELYGSGTRKRAAFIHRILPELCESDILSRKGRIIKGFQAIFGHFQELAAPKIPIAIRLPAEA